MPTWPSPRSEQLGAPNPPAIRFTRGTYFGASRFTHLLRPTKLLALLYGSDRYARPSRAFTSRLPTDRLPSPLLDMTTTATGLLCWRDFHPLEWQLASLHQIPACAANAPGSSLGAHAGGKWVDPICGPAHSRQSGSTWLLGSASEPRPLARRLFPAFRIGAD